MKTELAWWLAAMIDGEGSIMLNRRTRAGYTKPLYRCVISVANTDYRLMTALQDRIGCGQIYEHRVSNTMKSYNPRKRQQWTWRLNTTQVRVVLPEIQDLLVLKREQAVLLLEAADIKTRLTPGHPDFRQPTRDLLRSRMDAIYDEIRALNTRGREVPLLEEVVMPSEPELS